MEIYVIITQHLLVRTSHTSTAAIQNNVQNLRYNTATLSRLGQTSIYLIYLKGIATS